MTVTGALRTIGVALAALAVIDPGFAVTRDAPGTIEVRLGRGGAAGASDVQARIEQVFGKLGAGGAPAAVVLVDPADADLEALPEGLPVSFVLPDAALDVVRIEQPGPVLPGQTARIWGQIDASASTGREIVVRLEQAGVALAEHTPRVPEHGRVTVDFEYVPPASGVHPVRLVAAAGDGAVDRAFADVAVLARAQPLRVLVYEPRPSWAVTFVRRALEGDPALDVAAVARVSQGIASRTAEAPDRLTATTLERFDAILVGAPDALTDAETQALDAFARVRGGAVILQPDRLPSGPHVRLLPPGPFEEVLLDNPAPLASDAGTLQASELAWARQWPAWVTPIALRNERPAIVSWTSGAGRVVYAGALDAWRYRAVDGVAFDRFWQSLVADLAAAAARPLTLEVQPAVARPGDPIRVIARLRGAEGETQSIAAAVVEPDGSRRFVRLWPTAERGLFEGTLDAPSPGRYVAQATSGSSTADAPILVRDDVRQPRGVERGTLERIASATGGVVTEDPETLDRALAGLRTSHEMPVYPARSPWWFVGCVGALCGEWALRRRQGRR